MQLVVICLLRFFTGFQTSLSAFRFLDEFGIGSCFFLFFFGLLLGLEEIFLLILLASVDEDWPWDFDGFDLTICGGFVPHITEEILEVVQVLSVRKCGDIVNAQELRWQADLIVLFDLELLHETLKLDLLVFLVVTICTFTGAFVWAFTFSSVDTDP